MPVAIARLACSLSCFTEWRRGNSTGVHSATEGRPQTLKRAAAEPGEPRATASVSQIAEFDAESVRTQRQAPRRCAFGLLSPGEVFTGAQGLDLHLHPQAVVTKEPAHLQKVASEEGSSHAVSHSTHYQPLGRGAKPQTGRAPTSEASSSTGQTVGDASHTLTGPCVASQPEPTGGAGAKGLLAAHYRL